MKSRIADNDWDLINSLVFPSTEKGKLAKEFLTTLCKADKKDVVRCAERLFPFINELLRKNKIPYSLKFSKTGETWYDHKGGRQVYISKKLS